MAMRSYGSVASLYSTGRPLGYTMPTSNGGGTRPSRYTQTTSGRPLPPGPGPLDYMGYQLKTGPRPARGSSLSRATPKDRSEPERLLNREQQHNNLSSRHYSDSLAASQLDKLDLNGYNSINSSRRKNSTSHVTSNGAYGSYYNTGSPGSPSYTRQSSASSTYPSKASIRSYDETSSYVSTQSRSSINSVAAQNRNESCGSTSSDVKISSGPGPGNVGLTNLGNTCFMNSVLQCLLNTKPLVDYSISNEHKTDVNKTSSMKGAIFEEYSGLVRKVWSSSPPLTVAPRQLKGQVEKFAPRFSGYSQQDAQEFLRYILQGLHEDVNRIRQRPKYIAFDEAAEEKLSDEQKAAEYWRRYLNFDDSAITDLFVGQLKSTLTCQTCGYKSVTFDPFWDLSLPIPKVSYDVTIQDCLELFMKEEVLDDNERPTCAKCKTHRKCTKSFIIQRFPKILVLHLKRFSGDRYRSKLSTKVSFDVNDLDLKKQSAAGNTSASYNLYGICNHSGSVLGGHYTAYCKHPYQGKWYCFNDSSVNPITQSHLVSNEAYVLFYEKSSK